MKHLYEQEWFINFINYLRSNSKWFEKYGWGKSINMEDFVRNPFEYLRDHSFPFVIKKVKPFSFLIRVGYIPYSIDLEEEYLKQINDDLNGNVNLEFCKGTYKQYYDGKSLGFKIKKYKIIDLILSKWITKYPNAGFMLQFLISMKWYIIPIPFISLGLRFTKQKYFQFGFGWAPQWHNYAGEFPGDTSIDAALSAKLRIGDYKGELGWNPGSEVYGYWEGNV